MAETTGQEKTEAPTPRRLREARKDGNVARSPDLTAAIVLLGAIVLLYLLGMRVLGGMKLSLEAFMSASHAANPTRVDDLQSTVAYGLEMMVSSLAPLLLAVMGIALLAAVGQVGFLVTGKPLIPQFSKLSPIRGVQNLFSPRSLVRFLMSMGKVALVTGVAAALMYMERETLMKIGELHVGQAFAASAHLVFLLALKLAVVLLILALFDIAYQRWQHSEDLKMTKQEVKEEIKSMDGDPLVKQRRAQVARQLAMQRTAQAVPKADVIVTNPTHISIALKYDSSTMRAPKVIAKGADLMAMRIRQIAAFHEIPIVERKPLARALYAAVEVGQEVPPDHYAAIAEILAYVYRLSERKAG